MSTLPNCETCGKFHKCESGSAWRMVYSGWPPQPDREVTRCVKCVAKHGAFEPQHGIVAKYSCGVVR